MDAVLFTVLFAVTEAPGRVAERALDRRLAALTDRYPLAVQSASFSVTHPQTDSPLGGARFTVTAPVDHWKEAYEVTALELRRALAHGFPDAEIAAVRELVMRELEVMTLRDASRLSGQKAMTLLSAARAAGTATSTPGRSRSW